MVRTVKLAVIPGDGIGPEVVAEATKVLDAVAAGAGLEFDRTEFSLGAARFLPVTSDHAVVHKINQERLQAIAVESAEQCERGDVMEIAPLSTLREALNLPRRIVCCLERAEAPPLRDITQVDTLLIGPEGGFSPAEVSAIKEKDNIRPASLGSRILRAETALISALAVLQLGREGTG